MEMLVNANYQIMAKRKYFMISSLLLIAIGMVSILIKGGLLYGIDFAGGTLIQVKFVKPIQAEEIRKDLDVLSLGAYTIQTIGSPSENEFLIRLQMSKEIDLEASPNAKAISKLQEIHGEDQVIIRRIESVGPAIGEELKLSAKWAIVASIIMMLIYIGFRFEIKYGVGAIISLVHDVAITVGFLSLTNREIDMPIVAALLTLVGYSVNDTIVVFDRVRENVRLMHREKIEEIFNTSINQTLSRTILTSFTVFLVVLALYIFGGEVINSFAFTMLIGVVVGTYSSIYIASPYVIWWANLDIFGTRKNASKKQVSA